MKVQKMERRKGGKNWDTRKREKGKQSCASLSDLGVNFNFNLNLLSASFDLINDDTTNHKH